MNSAPTFRTDLFTYHVESKSFVSEVSTVTACGRQLTGQIYNDACDEGFNMTSKRSGRTVRFVFKEEKRDADGDLQVKIFQVDPTDARRYSIPREVTAHIINT